MYPSPSSVSAFYTFTAAFTQLGFVQRGVRAVVAAPQGCPAGRTPPHEHLYPLLASPTSVSTTPSSFQQCLSGMESVWAGPGQPPARSLTGQAAGPWLALHPSPKDMVGIGVHTLYRGFCPRCAGRERYVSHVNTEIF